MNNRTPLIEIKNLKKHFKIAPTKTVHAVDGITLDIFENEIVGLVGESGCGKSTLGRTLVGLYPKTDGEVTYKGKNQMILRCIQKRFR